MQKYAILAVLVACPALPQPGGISGPVLGYVPDGGGVRAILGVPGASLLGVRVPLGFDAAEVSPRGDYVLGVAGNGAVQVAKTADPAALRDIAGAAPSPERIALSPNGRAALLLYEGGAAIVTGLPDNPESAALDLAGVPGTLAAAAVSDDGAALIATANGLFLLGTTGDARPVPSAGAVSAAAFLPGSTDALVAGPGYVALLTDTGGRPALRLLANFDEDFGTPSAVAAGTRRAIVASGAAVAAVDMETGDASRLACGCTASALARLDRDLFRLTGVSAGPVWMVETGGPEARLVFVPPANEEEEGR